MNNTIILDHTSLFIYMDIRYFSSCHDVIILKHSTLYKERHQYFIHEENYFELLLGDPNYMGEEMFIMKRIERWELAPNSNLDAIQTYNKMHVEYRVQLKWGIKCLKSKLKIFMKIFDSTKPKLATSSNLLPYSLVSYIGGGNSHIRLLVNTFLI